MIEVNVGISQITGVRDIQQTRTVQCESMGYELGCIVFYRCRFVDGFTNPNTYYAMFAIPWNIITWISRDFPKGRELPNYQNEIPQ